MECEAYILNDGRYQCGNCGAIMDEKPFECVECGAVVVSIVDEGEADDSPWEEDVR